MPSLAVAREGAVLRITLARPEARNALDDGLTRALTHAFEDAARDPGVRCVVLAGDGPVFCAGGDLKGMRERRGRPDLTEVRMREGVNPLARAILMCPKPVVARVHGDAHGAGLMLAVLADFAIAASSARLGLTFARAGLVPDTGATWLLPRIIGLRAARELYLLADIIDAAKAVELGLVSRVVPVEDLDDAVDALAARLAEGPTGALGLGKRALVAGAFSSFEDALANEAASQALTYALDDQKEAVDAVLEKRAPTFSGR